MVPDARRPVCIGSGMVSLDIIYGPVTPRRPGSTDGAPDMSAGGSCGNVLTMLAYLGWHSYPLARLGDDPEASRILEDMKHWGVQTGFITHESYDTPRIIHNIRAGPKPYHTFSFRCAHGERLPGRRRLTLDRLASVMDRLPVPDVLYFDRAEPAAYELARHFRPHGTLVVFEPYRLRDDSINGRCVSVSDVVKYSSGDRSDLDVPLEVRTLGANGLEYRTNFLSDTRWRALGPYRVYELVDAAGSGDWLTAGFIHRMREYAALRLASGRLPMPARSRCGGPYGMLRQMDRTEIVDALDYGQALASINCSHAGARGMMYDISERHIHRAVNPQPRKQQCPHPYTHLSPSKCSPSIPASEFTARCRVCTC